MASDKIIRIKSNGSREADNAFFNRLPFLHNGKNYRLVRREDGHAPDLGEGIYILYNAELIDGVTDHSAPASGLRYDSAKNRLDLLPPEWEWALGLVTTKGSLKYAERNWEKGMQHSKMIGCMKRHLAKFLAGEEYDHVFVPDPEHEGGVKDEGTGCHHLAMVAWNALALMSYRLREIGENNLPVGSMDILNRCQDKPQ